MPTSSAPRPSSRSRTHVPSTLAEFDHGPREQRRLAGKALRADVPRTSHGAWEVGAATRDPVALLQRSSRGRVPELIPVRYARMATNAFAYYRGSPAIMAYDLARTPSTGLAVQACGDAHLTNFGGFGTPERNLAFDLNDFDETLAAPWEYDLKRLVASCVVASRNRGWADAVGQDAARAAARGYRETLTELSHLGYLEAWYRRVDVDAVIASIADDEARQRGSKVVAKARRRDGVHVQAKLTTEVDGVRRFIDDPPLIEHLPSTASERVVHNIFDRYLATVAPNVNLLLRRYQMLDVARKVVGVGSVGTRCFVVLLAGSEGEPLFLQVKEARASVLEPYVGRAPQANHGQRVVEGQRIMQAAGDAMLGWTNNGRHHYFIRQLRDWKLSIDLDRVSEPLLVSYAALCGQVLATAHARSGDAAKISGYLGPSDTFDRTMASFATAYADQNDADYVAFQAAVADGRLPVSEVY
jgi:uncharacterized protein (DUF2252 family)